MKIWKLLVIVGVLTQFFGHPMTTEIVGWDWCTEEGHAFVAETHYYGWPIPVRTVSLVYGCLSTPAWIEGMTDRNMIFWDVSFWVTVFWIASKLPEEYLK